VADDDSKQLLSDGDIESLISQAQTNVGVADADTTSGAAPDPVGGAAADAAPMELPTLQEQAPPAAPEAEERIDLLKEVQLNVKIELGRSRMYVDDVLKLSEGSIVPLDRLAGDPVDILVNDRLVAKGEVLVLNDNFCVRIAEILSANE